MIIIAPSTRSATDEGTGQSVRVTGRGPGKVGIELEDGTTLTFNRRELARAMFEAETDLTVDDFGALIRCDLSATLHRAFNLGSGHPELTTPTKDVKYASARLSINVNAKNFMPDHAALGVQLERPRKGPGVDYAGLFLRLTAAECRHLAEDLIDAADALEDQQ